MSFIYTQLDQNLVTNLNMRKFSFKSGDEPMIPQLLNGKNRISAPLWSSCCMYLVRCATVTIFLFSSIQYLFLFFCARYLLRSECAHFGIHAGLLRMWYNIQESEAFCFIWMENEKNYASRGSMNLQLEQLRLEKEKEKKGKEKERLMYVFGLVRIKSNIFHAEGCLLQFSNVTL